VASHVAAVAPSLISEAAAQLGEETFAPPHSISRTLSRSLIAL